jgi:hypothetical protein
MMRTPTEEEAEATTTEAMAEISVVEAVGEEVEGEEEGEEEGVATTAGTVTRWARLRGGVQLLREPFP